MIHGREARKKKKDQTQGSPEGWDGMHRTATLGKGEVTFCSEIGMKEERLPQMDTVKVTLPFIFFFKRETKKESVCRGEGQRRRGREREDLKQAPH